MKIQLVEVRKGKSKSVIHIYKVDPKDELTGIEDTDFIKRVLENFYDLWEIDTSKLYKSTRRYS
jgi:hypothetical protein